MQLRCICEIPAAFLASSAPGPDYYAAPDLVFSVSSTLKGMPKPRSSSRASLLVRAVVTIVMFIPCARVYLSGFNSGKTNC